MEEHTSDHEEAWTNEQSPLISPLGGTHDGGTHVGGTNDGGTHDGGTHEQSSGSNDPSKGFNFKRCMIIPMCACYFFAAGIYMYELPQYTQEVMKKRDDEKIVPHDIRPEYTLLYKSSGQSEHSACSSINKSDPNYKEFITIQQDTAIWQIYFNVGSLLPAMFANLVWASYSDIIGRKFSIFLCLAGFFVRTLGFTVVIYFNLSLVYIVIANILDGLTGSFTSLFALLFSYVSDITFTGRQRTIAIVVVELVIGLAVTVSSLASGPLIQETGYFYPAFGVSCLNFLAIVILIFLVPETMQNVNVQRQRCSVVKSIGESLRFYFCDGSRVTRAKYCLLIFGFFFMGIPALSRLSIEVLYQLGRPFCWSATKIGWFGAIKMAFASLFGISGAYVLKRCLRDDTIAFGTLVLSAAALLVEGLAKTDFVLYSVTVISAPSGLPFPMIRSLMSCLTPADKQGALFASIGFVETLCSLIGSLCSNTVYAATLSVMTGFVFLLMAALTMIGAFFVLGFIFVERKFKEPLAGTTIIVDPSISEEDA